MYRVEIRTMGGSALGEWEPTWTKFQFDVEPSDIRELVARALAVDPTADMEITDDIDHVTFWQGDAADFDIARLARA
jgi:hypothetical protein